MPHEVTCYQCGAVFVVPPARKDSARFCSNACKYESMRVALEPQPCEWCGTMFIPKSTKPRRFCSQSCRGKNNCTKGRRTSHCKVCGVCFEANTPDQPTCSKKCGYVYRNHRVTIRCRMCGKEVEERLSRRNKRKYCSRECYHLAMRKVRWPTKEQLEHLVLRASCAEVSKMYEVSERSVHHWCQVYGIKPLRHKPLKTRTSRIDHTSGYIGEAYGV